MSNSELPVYNTLECKQASTHVLQVCMNRPEVGNALNTQMALDMLDLWTRLTDVPGNIRCVILTGAGSKIFCAGGDLKERNGMTPQAWQHQHEIFERSYWAQIDLPLPVIGAVNGHAFGGGLEIALCCDFLYASQDARFAFPEVTLGIMPGMGGTQNLPRALGERRAKELIMTGRPMNGASLISLLLLIKCCRLLWKLRKKLPAMRLCQCNKSKNRFDMVGKWNCAQPIVLRLKPISTWLTPTIGEKA